MSTIFPPNPTIGQEYSGYIWDGVSWNLLGDYPTTDFITQAEFDNYVDGTIKTYIQDTEPNFNNEKAIWVQTGLGPSLDKFSVWINT